MTKECTHTPRCLTCCRICKAALPEFSPRLEGERFTYLVEYENGSKNVIVGCVSEKEAGNQSNASLARSAGLCLNHLVRITNVRKVSTEKALDEIWRHKEC